MGLFSLLLRALMPRRRRGRSAIWQTTKVIDSRNSAFLGVAPRVAIRQITGIRIVETPELRGRAWVIDGDTLDIDGTRIRLAGIDAPEIDQPYGKNAKWALVNFCNGQIIRAVFHGDVSHDRPVATCYLPDGRDLSAEMVKAGMAIDWPKFSRGKYSKLELPGIRQKLWRCDARQKGWMPPALPD